MKRLIIYYSFDGNTKEAAEKIAKELSAELLELRVEKEIPRDEGKKFMVGGMQAIFGFCSNILNESVSAADYDEIILGTPIWADKCNPAVLKYVTNCKLEDKVTAVFTCSGGGDNDKCIAAMKKKFHHIRHIVALAERNNPVASENEERIRRFTEQFTQ